MNNAGTLCVQTEELVATKNMKSRSESVQLAAPSRHSPQCYNSHALFLDFFFFPACLFSLGGEKGQTTTLSIKRHKRAKGGG